jgi:CRISPR-associated endonuclease Csn1
MSRLAMEYVGLLYGGAIDAAGRRRVQVSAGAITAYLRAEWGLNAILADGGAEKNRDDHRHHSVDAVCIALTDAATVKQLSDSAARAGFQGYRRFTPMDTPWPTFLEDVRASVDAINISYRVSRRVSGALHEETNYSKPQTAPDKSGRMVEFRHVRKPLAAMSVEDVDKIVDGKIRELVRESLGQGGEPKKVFADPAKHPYLTAANGRKIFVHKARIRKAQKVVALGAPGAPRFVAPGTNHHMEIVAIVDGHGVEKRWEAGRPPLADPSPVSLIEAAERIRRGEPVIRRDHGAGKKFKFSLAGGEYVEMEGEEGKRSLFRVTVISGNQVEFRLHTDARPITVLKMLGARVRRSPETLRKAGARKVAVDPLGNILPAND